MTFALINAADAVVRFQVFAAAPPALPPEKGLRWLPVEDVKPDLTEGQTLDGPVVTIAADKVLRVWAAVPAPPPPVPPSITPFQARAALRQAGKLDKVEAYFLARPAIEQDAWEYGQEICRNSRLLLEMSAGLDWSDADVDNLFRAAAKITA